MRMWTRFGCGVVLGGTLLGAVALPGRAQQDRPTREGAGEKVGESLDQAGRAVRRGIERAAGDLREGFLKTRTAVNSMGVEARVYGRLHWDKALAQAELEVHVREGVATLRGAVPDAAARTHAVDLAATTVGIERVVDELSIVAAAGAADTPAGAGRDAVRPAPGVRPR